MALRKLAPLARKPRQVFTREVLPDGKVEYVIDRTKLSGEDVKYLRSRGALTRRGIQQYFVGRR